MNAAVLLLVIIIAFSFAYKFYGNFLSKVFSINNSNETPSHTNSDGVDFVSAKLPVLFGHHFASIAGVGPIVGPVLALVFGWLPIYLWIMFGAVLIGGVHDYSSMVASIRHKGKTIGSIIQSYMGNSGKKLFLFFTWATMLLVMAVFAIIISDTFVSIPSVGTSSILFILVAVIFGYLLYSLKLPLKYATLIGLLLLGLAIYSGLSFPLGLSKDIWMLIIFGYVFIASVVPVWILLQPRDYLNSFFLYAILIGGFVGVLFANPTLQAPATTTFSTAKLGFLFPALFVTVACGAISGFHSIVSSGTTSKQLDKETDAKVIGYGGMLVEGVLAVIALLAVSAMSPAEYLDIVVNQGPVAAFSIGVARFISKITFLNIPFDLATSFIALGVAAFALTTLDTSTRLARYTFQEFFDNSKSQLGKLFNSNRYIGTAITVFFALLLTFSGKTMTLWPIFGSANQLLAALALLAITVWLASTNRNYILTFIPMIFMFAVTLTSLASLFYTNSFVNANYALAVLSFVLFTLAVLLAFFAGSSLKSQNIIKEN